MVTGKAGQSSSGKAERAGQIHRLKVACATALAPRARAVAGEQRDEKHDEKRAPVGAGPQVLYPRAS